MEFQLNFKYQNKSIFNSTKGWHQDTKLGRVVSIVEETPLSANIAFIKYSSK